jgi:phosphohistidine swiveling domain-containing protein
MDRDVAGAVLEIEAELGSPIGRVDRVEGACARLRAAGSSWIAPESRDRLLDLATLVTRQAGAVVDPVAALLQEAAAGAEDAWPFLERLLAAPASRIALSALDLAVRLSDEGRLVVGTGRAGTLAALVEARGSPLSNREALERVAKLLRPPRPDTPEADPLIELYAGEAPHSVRRLLARVLDLPGRPPGPALAARMLGEEACRFLAPYLAYTRATHLDLLDLVPGPGVSPPALASLRRAEAVCGEALLREILAQLGWSRVNAGLTVQPYVGVSAGGSFPLLLTPAEAALVDGDPGIHRVFERWLVVAHGGALAREEPASAGPDPVNDFRSLNLLHADALGDILDVAPLTAVKVRRILERMDRIVDGFCALFTGQAADECRVVADVYRDLKVRAEGELARLTDGKPLTAELTRLVQMFEDPRTAGDVRTVHGLKRYLHQKGLQLGFRLAEAGRGTNRTVDLAVVTPPRVTQLVHAIEYVDFEPEPGTPDGPPGIPWPVRIAAEGFGRQLLHGQETLPKLRAFCYGNEVHYFLAFANHPLFLRVDLAPPLRGGMLDLEYYGVSKYQLDAHPNPSLDSLGVFFRRLDIAAEIENTRIHARYDKERAADLADLCDKIEALFRLAPYLMDVDWVIGDLSLDAGARAAVAEAWADFFARWGVLPVSQLLTSDRLGILLAVEADAAGLREVRWNGTGAYRDRFSAGAPAGLRSRFRASLEARRLPCPAPNGDERPIAQLELERDLLGPLRAALARGEAHDGPGGLEAARPELFERRHEASWFAELLAGDAERIARAASVARVVSALQRHLRFQTTGTVNGYEVQRAELTLSGQTVALHVLRDAAGIARLAFATLDGILYRVRDDPSDAWRENAVLDTEGLEARLRRNNVPVSLLESEATEAEAEALRRTFYQPNPYEASPRLPGERLVAGIPAAPGRATGPARLGLKGREPVDVDGGILVTASLRPDDAPFLLRAAGVVSTGGGVLSHAGLLAMQYGKPALVAGGRWEETEGEPPSVVCLRVEADEVAARTGPLRVVEHRNRREREDRIREGDLLIVDADAGLLGLLGRDRDALALHEGLRQLVSATRRLPTVAGDDEVLALRGRRLRARHQLERLLGRMQDPVLARHAVRELLAGEAAAGGGDPADLLRTLLANAAVGEAARAALHAIAMDLTRRHTAGRDAASRVLQDSRDPYEILALRRDVVRIRERLATAASCMASCGIETGPSAPEDRDLDALAARSLRALRDQLAERVAREEASAGPLGRVRHLLEQLGRLDAILETPAGARERLEGLERRLAADDEAAQARLADRWIVLSDDGGAELRPVVGSKAAGLAESVRLGEGTTIPGWFVVTDRAFREVLGQPAPEAAALAGPANGGLSLRDVIDRILTRPDGTPEARSALVRRAWQTTPLPPDLVDVVTEAYERLAPVADPFVAIRSSATEEDTEAAARAGEFDTFLFVRGSASVLEHLRLAWAGLWSARALHARRTTGAGWDAVGGGVLVQRMVDARVSGVLHTVNVAAGRPREMLINAGLGLGEGVVSGLVAADQITVEKDASLAGDDLHFSYQTRDKRERVVFNARAGRGTMRVETLYHQRLRPALEYVELCELVHAAARLEAAWGHALDIEFAIEGPTLRLLQVRPVPAALAVWRETAERLPLRPGGFP